MAKQELVATIRDRYRQSSKKGKGRILDEFTAITGHHRKHGIRLLSGAVDDQGKQVVGRRIYGEAVREAVIVVWEASDLICGKRLKAALPNLVDSMERHGHLSLDPLVREHLLSASAATLDRLLKPIRPTAGSRRRRKRRPYMGIQVPVRTYNDWNWPPPGFLEIDLVAHCGGTLSGSTIHSLVSTAWYPQPGIHSLAAIDICTGWTEAVPLPAREQSLVIEGLVVEGLEAIAGQLPFPVLGIDSDNDSVFINQTLIRYCADRGIEFTRFRAYRKNDQAKNDQAKNDQAWIEQKNGSVVRRFAGYDRYSGRIAGQTMVHRYKAVRLHVNYFQPSFKLLEKIRDGARVINRYSPPATPCDRLMQHDETSVVVKNELREYRAGLDPVALLRSIREAQSWVAAMSLPQSQGTPHVESIDRFLARLPNLWQQGEARPTHRAQVRSPRHWRTRKDPFEGVWRHVLLWLQKDPDTNANDLLAKLRETYPGRFGDAQLRTLQRRVKDWRGVMAKGLIYAASDEPASEPSEKVDLVLVGVGNKG